ncbi:MAG: putative hydrolase/acyltransferase [Microbacteriaceae bacterium]|nr:putative hydrolase/acyltransferase [Microbacteriaceae bacterium]
MDFAINPADGIRIAYRASGSTSGSTSGTGPPIVMVHGTALSQAIWRGFGYSRGLGTDHRVITLDLRGHGRSDKPHVQSAYSNELFVGDVLAVLDQLGVDRAHYLGYSLGGRVGFSLAAAHPERMLSFVTAGGAPRIGRGSFDRVFFPGCVDVLESGDMDRFLDAWERSGATLDATTMAAFRANDALALAAYMRAAEDDAGVTGAALANIRLPTLLLVGSDDSTRLRSAMDALKVMPSATLRVLDGANHSDTLRHPEALPAVREFIASVATA